MIVIDEENPDVKAAHLQRATAGGSSESSQLVQGVQGPPPAYSNSAGSSYGAVYNAPLHFPEDVPAPGRRPRFVRGENARRRFLKALVIAVGIWVLIAIVTVGDVDLIANRTKEGRKHNNGRGTVPHPPGREPVESDGRIRDSMCIIGPRGDGSSSDNRYSTKLKFSLPVESNLAFFANDTYAYGTFVVDVKEGASSDVDVDVVISYQTQEALQRSKVCLNREPTESTIGVMAAKADPAPPSNANVLRYDIYVKLPVSGSNTPEPLHIPRLTADFVLFSMAIADLSEYVEFGEINLKTFGSRIAAESLMAHKARLQTSQASIQGNFTTSSSLELVTEDAPIQVDISMLNSSPADHPPTLLTMHTKSAAISARLNLSNPSASLRPSPRSPLLVSNRAYESVGGNFKIDSSTTDASLSLSVLTQPYSSHLTLSAYTSSATAQVILPPQFSGGFRLATSVLTPVLDLSSRGRIEGGYRHRDVNLTTNDAHLLEGHVTWVDGRGGKEQGNGFVDVRTSVLPAILRL